MTLFDLIDSYETKVKANSDLWNEDETERAKDTYTGFRAIVKSIKDTENLDSSYFPILAFDALETDSYDNSANVYIPDGGLINITVYCSNDQEGVSTFAVKKESSRLHTLTLSLLGVMVQDTVAHISTLLRGAYVCASVAIVEV